MDTILDDTPLCLKTCEVCGRSFSKTSHLLRHSRSHAEEKPYTCSVCNKGFARTDALKRHRRTMHSGNKRRRTRATSTGSSSDTRAGDASSTPLPQPSGNPPTAPTPGISFSIDPIPGWFTGQPRPSAAPMDPPAMEGNFASSNLTHTQSAFFQTLPNAYTPSNSTEVDEMIAQWLNQDAGTLGGDRTLAALFSDQFFVEPEPAVGQSPWPAGGPSACSRQQQRHQQEQLHDRQPRPSHISDNASLSNQGSSQAGPTPRSVMTTASSRRVLAADTWESGMVRGEPSPYTSRAASPQPPHFTSPQQVVGQLDFLSKEVSTLIDAADRDTVIPSMKFLDVCIHLYFRCFHSSLPVIHRPTFRRDRASWHVLLSMVSIGCMFVGTQAASESGQWIHRRLHLSTILGDFNMADEKNRSSMILSSTLGQAFGFLYGQPQQMLTTDTYHESVCSMARRNGLLIKVKPNPISYADVEHLDSAALERKWREWAQQEMLRRVSLGLTIHGAELTIYSGIARLVPADVISLDRCGDALFEAENAATWRRMLKRFDNDPSPHGPCPSRTFQSTVILSHALAHIYTLRQLENTPFGESLRFRKLFDFNEKITSLAKSVDIWPALEAPHQPAPAHVRSLAAIWHYMWVAQLAPTSDIEDVAGRNGEPSSESILKVQSWVKTPAARLATLHCGHILYRATDLNDLCFLLPRIIFQATVVLLCYSAFVDPPSETDEAVDIIQAVDWERLVLLYDLLGPDGGSSTDSATRSVSPSLLATAQERYLAEGGGMIQVPGYIEGIDLQMDTFTLRSSSNLLLRRCTPWGIGATLAEILSNISF